VLGVFETLDLGDGDDRLEMWEVARRENLARVLFRDVDALDRAVGNRAAHERDLQRAGKADVGHELSDAVQVSPVFLSPERRPDAFPGFFHHSCLMPISFTSLPYFWMSASRIFLNSGGVV
jgi:hypothetical protein